MSTTNDITNEKRSATKGAACRTESENHPAHGLACDYADLVHRHEKRTKALQQQPEPAEELDYDAEGMPPHN